MLNNYSHSIGYLTTTICISFFTALFILNLIHKSSAKFLSFLFVESPKSPTSARLLGGLAIGSAIIASLIPVFFKHYLATSAESVLLASFITSIVFISASGYIDDRFEIRARYKLFFQLVSLSIFSYHAAKYLEVDQFLGAYAVITGIGFLMVNGTNLLDGLDTLAIKLSVVTSFAFILLGSYSQSPMTVYISVATIGSLAAFYLYNRAPAKIYLGEIGGSLLGLIFTAQAILCFKAMGKQQPLISNISLVLLVTSLPIFELGMSFLRRIYFKKSPFKGDKLHFHYVLKNKGKMSTSAVTNIMSLGNLTILATGFAISTYASPLSAILFVNSIYAIIYVRYCKSEWMKGQESHSIDDIFQGLQNKSVYLINSSDLDRVNYMLEPKIFSTEDENAA